MHDPAQFASRSAEIGPFDDSRAGGLGHHGRTEAAVGMRATLAGIISYKSIKDARVVRSYADRARPSRARDGRLSIFRGSLLLLAGWCVLCFTKCIPTNSSTMFPFYNTVQVNSQIHFPIPIKIVCQVSCNRLYTSLYLIPLIFGSRFIDS